MGRSWALWASRSDSGLAHGGLDVLGFPGQRLLGPGWEKAARAGRPTPARSAFSDPWCGPALSLSWSVGFT